MWDYRVIRKGEEYAIHEVYYDDQGAVETCTVEPVGVAGDTLAELREDLAHYIRALDRPVLVYEEMPAEYAPAARAMAAYRAGETTPYEEFLAELLAEGALD